MTKDLELVDDLSLTKKQLVVFFLNFFMYFIKKNAMDMDMGSVKVRGVLLLIYIFL
jgi:hypothetical protein